MWEVHAKPKYHQDNPLQTHWGRLSMGSWHGPRRNLLLLLPERVMETVFLISFFSPKECFIDYWWQWGVERNLSMNGHLVLKTGKTTWGTGWAFVIGSAGEGADSGKEESWYHWFVCRNWWWGYTALTQTQENLLHTWATLSWLFWEGWGGTEFQRLQSPASKGQPSRREPGIILIAPLESPGGPSWLMYYNP